MKLPIFQLDSHLSYKLAPIYVVSGDEILLVEEVLEAIRQAAIKAGFSERIRIQPEGADWAPAFYAASQSQSLFATQRLLELNLTTAKFTAATSKVIQEYAQNSPADTVLLLRMNKLDNKSEQSSWYKAIDKIGIFIPVWPISLDQLPNWIKQRAKKLNLTFTTGAAMLLAQHVEGNLLAAAQEIEKLALLQPSQPIDEAVIEQTATDNSHFDVFALVDSMLAGNANRSLQILRTLRAEDIEPTLILWALCRELRTMSELSKLRQQGTGLQSLFPKYRIFEKRQPFVRAFLERHTQESCWQLLLQGAELDRIIKGAVKGQVWLSLEKLCLSAAGDVKVAIN